MTSFSGNRGEWAELYALCKLLGDGCLYNADANLEKNEAQRAEIEAIIRQEDEDRKLEYRIEREEGQVLVLLNGCLLRTLPRSLFAETAVLMLRILRNRKGRAFEIPEIEGFVDAIGIAKLKPSGTEKPDMIVEIFDPRTSSRYTTSYSIKSFIGAKPSLVNSSALTYFFYELVGFDDEDFDEVSKIPANKVKRRVKACRELASDVRFAHLSPDAGVFHENLMRVHPYAEATLGYLVLESYAVRGKHSLDVLANVMRENPMGYDSPSMYEDAYREYLWAAFFGMVPSKPWGRRDSVDGYLLINEEGTPLSYLVVKRNAFGDHLLEATSFDTPSTSPGRPTCDTGTVFYENGSYYLALNLQIKYSGKLTPQKRNSFSYEVVALSQGPTLDETSEGDSSRESPSERSFSRFRIIE